MDLVSKQKVFLKNGWEGLGFNLQNCKKERDRQTGRQRHKERQKRDRHKQREKEREKVRKQEREVETGKKRE